ncbi:DMT family transporter [Parashewanella spongiae]|uniref:DMT family transporter n=1 Tax=Parashewanella spongiae TaxID=342950 RepID=A0A3A6UB36_9GAMM|nr:DMT family transporter [Parashewanella spongiae]MCL1078267.1 DMT family transporter [Parashewanella spongiae]RJY18787.1 DMT family transporter [Parashewanella spongiae]
MALPKFKFDIHLVTALIGGAILAVMIQYNGQLAEATSPIHASWFAHVIGALASIGLIFIVKNRKQNQQHSTEQKTPLWAYSGGIPGALIVVLSGITINSELGLAGTLVLGLVGQIVWGLVCDHLGWFGIEKKAINWKGMFSIVPILLGSFVIIYTRLS